MIVNLRSFWQSWFEPKRLEAETVRQPSPVEPTPGLDSQIDIAPDDPLLDYMRGAAGPVEIDRLSLNSIALVAMQAAGVKLTVPLVSQGELIGLINLGPRLSEQEYSTDDRRLLESLATQAAPAVRVAQLVKQQQAEARIREQLEQELQIARLIQQTLLPKDIPNISGWELAAYYQPAGQSVEIFTTFSICPTGALVCWWPT